MQSNRVVLELLELEKRFEQGVKLSNEIDQKIITLQNTASESNDNDSNTSNYYSSSDDQSNTSNQSNTSEQEEEKEEEEEKDEEEKLNNVHKFNAEKIAAFIAKQTDKTFWELCDVLSPTDKNEISHTINNHISTLNLPDYPKNNDRQSLLNYNQTLNSMIKNKDIIFATQRSLDMQDKVLKGEYFGGVYKWVLFNSDKNDISFLKPYTTLPANFTHKKTNDHEAIPIDLRKAIIGIYGGSFIKWKRIGGYCMGKALTNKQIQLTNILKTIIDKNDTKHVVILVDKALKNDLQKDDSLTADDYYNISRLKEMYLVKLMDSNMWSGHGINEEVQIISLTNIQKIVDIMKQKYASKIYDIQKLNDMIEYGIKIRTRATGNAHAINMQTVKIMCEYSQARHFCAEFNMITPIGVVCDHSTCNTLPYAMKLKVAQRMSIGYPFTRGIRQPNKVWYQNGQKFTFQMLWVITHQKYIDKFKHLVQTKWMIQNQIRTKDLPPWRQLNEYVGCAKFSSGYNLNSPIQMVVQEFAKQNGYRLCTNGKTSKARKKWLEKNDINSKVKN
eukprot:177603_1